MPSNYREIIKKENGKVKKRKIIAEMLEDNVNLIRAHKGGCC